MENEDEFWFSAPQSDLPSQQQEMLRPGNWSGVQADIVQLGHSRQKIKHDTKSLRHGDWETGRPLLPQVRMAPKTQKIRASGIWQLIMQQNERRIYFIVSNTTGSQLQISFGKPIGNVGILCAVGGKLGGTGFSCPLEEIYVLSGSAGSYVVAYEGVPTTKDYGPKRDNS